MVSFGRACLFPPLVVWGAILLAGCASDEGGSLSARADLAQASRALVDPTLVDSDTEIKASDGVSTDFFGRSVGSGDFNGDGFTDVVVGAQWDDDGGNDAGAIYLYYGSSAGIDLESEDKITASSSWPDLTFGCVVAGVGDVDNDGFDEVMASKCQGGNLTGAVYLYYGGESGIDAETEVEFSAFDGFGGDSFGAGQLGTTIAAAGDVNNDTFGDVIVAAERDNDLGGISGSAYLYYGSEDGLVLDSVDKILPSDGEFAWHFAASVSGAGDVNDDGFDDIIVGATGADDNGSFAGAAYLYYGTEDGIDLESEQKLVASDGVAQDQFGVSVSGAGDLNRDGFADVIVGAVGDEDSPIHTEAGSAYVFYGARPRLDASTEQKIVASDADIYRYFGTSVSDAGDVDGDTYDDVVVGSRGGNGAAYLFYGSETGLLLNTEDQRVTPEAPGWDSFGVWVSAAGDVNGDELGDVIVGAQIFNNSTGRGSAFVLARNYLPTISEVADRTIDEDSSTGVIEVTVGDHVNKLKTAESLHFNSGVRHKMRNIGKENAELLVVVYGP